MDKLKFAELVGFITAKLRGDMLDNYDIEQLDKLVTVQPIAPITTVSYGELNELLRHMAEGVSKIAAIKSYRSLTGGELKEAKDAVERYWKPNQTGG